MAEEVKTEEVTRITCGFCSGGACGLNITVKNGRAIKAEPDFDFMMNPGPYCVKWKYSLEYIYHPMRLNFPLKRVGKRGEDKWEIISWEQALDEIAARLKELIAKYGPETVLTSAGTGRAAHIHMWMQKFMNLIGSPNFAGLAASI